MRRRGLYALSTPQSGFGVSDQYARDEFGPRFRPRRASCHILKWPTRNSLRKIITTNLSVLLKRLRTFVVGVGDRVNQFPSERREGSNSSIIPCGYDTFSVERKYDSGGDEIRNDYPQQFHLLCQRPHSDGLMTRRGEHKREFAIERNILCKCRMKLSGQEELTRERRYR